MLIHIVMIKSFKDSLTEDVFNGVVRKGFPADLIKVARRKLRYLHAAHILSDLRVPPGNRLEALKGNRLGSALDPRKRSVPDLLCLDFGRPKRRRAD
jgi:proteic killer suppression protein